MNNSIEKFAEALSNSVTSSDLRSAEILSNISLCLIKYRMDHKMDQKAFAKCLGVSQPMVSKYESGNYNFTIRSLVDITEKLEVNFNGFIKEVTDDKDSLETSICSTHIKKRSLKHISCSSINEKLIQPSYEYFALDSHPLIA